MARLDAAQRQALPASDFGGPNRSYPMPDSAHAKLAKAMASRYATPQVRAQVDAKANRMLGETMK